jgi:hypothetical protein
MFTVSLVKIDIRSIYHWWVGHESPVHIALVIMTNATSNVAVGFPAIPGLPVTIITVSISFLI